MTIKVISVKDFAYNNYLITAKFTDIVIKNSTGTTTYSTDCLDEQKYIISKDIYNRHIINNELPNNIIPYLTVYSKCVMCAFYIECDDMGNLCMLSDKGIYDTKMYQQCCEHYCSIEQLKSLLQ